MSEITPFEEVQRLFASLGVKDFDAALPEGRIRWLDEHGAEVAHARCSAVLSWAGGNRSLCWAEALPHFVQAGVPTVARPDGLPEYQEGLTKELAEGLAGRAARDSGAEFLYEAKTGGGGALYLAVIGFTPGAQDGGGATLDQRVRATNLWMSLKLRRLGEHVAADKADSVERLTAFAAELRKQAGTTVAGTPLAQTLTDLAADIDTWGSGLPAARDAVAGALTAAASGFATS